MILEISQNSQEHTCARDSFFKSKACNFVKKESLAEVLSCEFCEISKNTFFTEHLQTTAFGMNGLVVPNLNLKLVLHKSQLKGNNHVALRKFQQQTWMYKFMVIINIT